MTGDPKREIYLGVNTQLLRKEDKFEQRKFSFQSFQFPACEVCNNKYSKLEGEVKPIIEKIISHGYTNNDEINTLLDWFDKVRTGLWLGSLLLDSEIAPVNPKFFINQRIASKDRGLMIYELNDEWKGTQFMGFNSPAFQFSPSCFSLTINNHYFFNFSYEFLFSKELGFPYAKNTVFQQEDDMVLSNMKEGLENIGKRPIKIPIKTPSIEIYQPIFSKKLIEIEDSSRIYNSDFIKEHSFNYDNGLGSIFYRDGNKILPLDFDSELQLSDSSIKYDRNKFEKIIAKQVFDFQSYLLKKMPSTKNLDKESKTYMDEKIKSIEEMQNKFATLIKL